MPGVVSWVLFRRRSTHEKSIGHSGDGCDSWRDRVHGACGGPRLRARIGRWHSRRRAGGWRSSGWRVWRLRTLLWAGLRLLRPGLRAGTLRLLRRAVLSPLLPPLVTRRNASDGLSGEAGRLIARPLSFLCDG